jgi:two-component system, NtrC family, response regulator HydG
MIKDGKFRQDLYYRLRVGLLRIPPLRERGNDLRLLTTQFLQEFNQRHGKTIHGVSNTLWRAFDNYPWPGNVRELRNQIESMVIQDVDGELGLDDLMEGDPLRASAPAIGDASPRADHLIGRPLSEVERYYAEKALELSDGNREAAANMLGIGERTLYRQIQEWKVQDALASVGGDPKRAAKILGITPDALEKKLKKRPAGKEDE